MDLFLHRKSSLMRGAPLTRVGECIWSPVAGVHTPEVGALHIAGPLLLVACFIAIVLVVTSISLVAERVWCPWQATDKLFPKKSYNIPTLAQMWLSNFSTSYLKALFYGNISVFKSVEAGNQNFVTKYNIHQTCWEARTAFSSIRWWAASKYSQECMTSWAVTILKWNQVGLRELTAYLGHPDHMSTLHSNVVYCIASSFPPRSAIHTVTVPVAHIKQERIYLIFFGHQLNLTFLTSDMWTNVHKVSV